MTGLDLDARQLTFGWNYISDDGPGLQVDIRVQRIGASRSRLLATQNTDPRGVGATAPSLDGGSVVWGYISAARGGGGGGGGTAFRAPADARSAPTMQTISPRTQSLSSARSVLYADISIPRSSTNDDCVGSSSDSEPNETIGIGCAIVRQPFGGE